MLPTDIRLTTSGRRGRSSVRLYICPCGYRAKPEVRPVRVSSRHTSSVNGPAPTCKVKQEIACLLCRGLCGLDSWLFLAVVSQWRLLPWSCGSVYLARRRRQQSVLPCADGSSMWNTRRLRVTCDRSLISLGGGNG